MAASAQVNINVNQTSTGTAISDAEKDLRKLQAEQERLAAGGATAAAAKVGRRLDVGRAADYKTQESILTSTAGEAKAERASGNIAAAQTLEREVEVRKESLRLQKKMQIFESEAEPLAKQNVESSAKIAQAKQEEAAAARRAAAQEKIRRREENEEGRRPTVGGSAADGALRGLGLPGMGTLTNPALAVGAAVAAVVAKTVADAIAKYDFSAQVASETAVGSARRSQIGGWFGSRGQDAASGNYLGNRQALEEAQTKQGNAAHTFFGDLIEGANRAFGTSFESSRMRKNRETDAEVGRLSKEMDADKKQAAEKFMKGTGGDELEAMRREGRGDFAGARALRYREQWNKDYKKIFDETGSDDLANQFAGQATFNAEKQRRLGIAGGLVNARSGAGDIAAAARSVGSAQDISRDIARQIEGLHETVIIQHKEAIGTRHRRQF